MPSLGEGIIEASVIKILREVGDFVEEDEPVLEIATDKVDSEIVALEKGVIEEIKVKPGDIVKVGEVVIVLKTETVNEKYSPSFRGPEGDESFVLNKTTSSGTSPFKKESPEKMETTPEKESSGIQHKDIYGADVKSSDEKKKTEQTYDSPIQEAVGHSEPPKKIFLSPLVKKIMKEEGLSYGEVCTLKGSGYMGRITREDITKYLQYKREGAIHGENPKEITIASSVSQEEIVREKKEAAVKKGKVYFESSGSVPDEEKADIPTYGNKVTEEYSEQEMDRVRMLIAQHTLESKKTSPHVTSFIEVDVSAFKRIREENKQKYINDYGIKLTYTPFFIAAASMALEKFPEINSSVSGNKIRHYHHINIGIATALANGNLIVPVIKNTESMNLRGISTRLNELAQKARTNSLDPGDITGGTFTISNFGSFNTMAGTPIILQPQSAILGIGEIKKRAVVIESDSADSISIRPIAIISLSYDHRIIDGALAGNFLGYLRECIEDFKP